MEAYKEHCINQFKHVLGLILSECIKNQSNELSLDLQSLRLKLFCSDEIGHWPLSMVKKYGLFDDSGFWDEQAAERLGVYLSLESLTIPEPLEALPLYNQVFYTLLFLLAKESLINSEHSELRVAYLLSNRFIHDIFHELEPAFLTFTKNNFPSYSARLRLTGLVALKESGLIMIDPQASIIDMASLLARNNLNQLFLVGAAANKYRDLYWPELNGEVSFKTLADGKMYAEPYQEIGQVKTFKLVLHSNKQILVHLIDTKNNEGFSREERLYLSDLNERSLAKGETQQKYSTIAISASLDEPLIGTLLDLLVKLSRKEQAIVNEIYSITETKKSVPAITHEQPQPFVLELLLAKLETKTRELIYNDERKGDQLISYFFHESKEKILENRLLFQFLAERLSSAKDFQRIEELSDFLKTLLEDSSEVLYGEAQERLFVHAFKLRMVQFVLIYGGERLKENDNLFSYIETTFTQQQAFINEENAPFVFDIYQTTLALFFLVEKYFTLHNGYRTLSGEIKENLSALRPLVKIDPLDRLIAFIDKIRLKVCLNVTFELSEEEKNWFEELSDLYEKLLLSYPVGANTLRKIINEGYAPACELIKNAILNTQLSLNEEKTHVHEELILILDLLSKRSIVESDPGFDEFLQLMNKVGETRRIRPQEFLMLESIMPLVRRRKQNTEIIGRYLQEANDALESYFLKHYKTCQSNLKEKLRILGKQSEGKEFELFKSMENHLEQDEANLSWYTEFIRAPLLLNLKNQLSALVNQKLFNVAENKNLLRDGSIDERGLRGQFDDLKEKFIKAKNLSWEVGKALEIMFSREGTEGENFFFRRLESLTNQFILNHSTQGEKVVKSFIKVLTWVDGFSYSEGDCVSYLDVVYEKIVRLEPILLAMKNNLLIKTSLGNREISHCLMMPNLSCPEEQEMETCKLPVFSEKEQEDLKFLQFLIPETVKTYNIEKRAPLISISSLKRELDVRDANLKRRVKAGSVRDHVLDDLSPLLRSYIFLKKPYSNSTRFLSELLSFYLLERQFELSFQFKSLLVDFICDHPKKAYLASRSSLSSAKISILIGRLKALIHGSKTKMVIKIKLQSFSRELENRLDQGNQSLQEFLSLPEFYQIKIMIMTNALMQTQHSSNDREKNVKTFLVLFLEALECYKKLYQKREFSFQFLESRILRELINNYSDLNDERLADLLSFLDRTLKTKFDFFERNLAHNLNKEAKDSFIASLGVMNDFYQRHGRSKGLDLKLLAYEKGIPLIASDRLQDELFSTFFFLGINLGSLSLDDDADQMSFNFENKRLHVWLMDLYKSLMTCFNVPGLSQDFDLEVLVNFYKDGSFEGLGVDTQKALVIFSCFLERLLQREALIKRLPEHQKELISHLSKALIPLKNKVLAKEVELAEFEENQSRLLALFTKAHQQRFFYQINCQNFGFLRLSPIGYNSGLSLEQWVKHAQGKNKKLWFFQTGARSFETMKSLGWLNEEKEIVEGSDLQKYFEKSKSIMEL